MGRGRRGLALPVVLLVVLALGLLSTTLLVVAHGERAMALQVLEYLRARVRAADRLTEAVPAAPGGESEGPEETGLRGGFVLLQVGSGAAARFAVRWQLRPDSVLARLPGAVETSVAPSESGIEALSGCPSASSRALVRVRGGPFGAPGLGPIGVDELSPLATVELEAGDSLPGGAETGVFRIVGPADLEGGEASGLLVSQGDLVLRGSARFVGLVLVEGRLRLEDRAQLEGVLLARTLQVSDDARVFGCPASARAALELPELDRSHPVRGGENLGRF